MVAALVERHFEVLLFTLAALLVRLVWNLLVHKPLDFAYSDMGGYLERAQTSIDHPGEKFGYFTLFPWGTHVFLALLKRAFGAASGTAIGVAYAAVGAGAVGFTVQLARRLTRSVWIARAVGAVLVVYYPWISLGGYTLSEPPFSFFFAATAYYGLCVADRGRPRDAWLFGISIALAAIFRPQVLVALPLYALHFVFRRQAWRRFSPRLLVGASVPLALALALSVWRMEHHTGRFGLISNNGPVNYAFGRCHALVISSVAPDRKSSYAPTSLGALANYEKAHPDSWIKLHPAMDTKLTFQGHMWDAEPIYRLASECVKKAGPVRQIEFALTHVVLLWGYNIIWPDQSQRPEFRRPMEVYSTLHGVLVLPAAAVALALAFRRRHARVMLAALHVYALLGVAMLYFGDARLRAPYDGILVLLAATTYAAAYRAIRRRRAETGAAAT
jgi:hypothetical protein